MIPINFADMSYSSSTGLSEEQVKQMRKEFGSNLLTPPPRAAWWKELLEKFNDPTIQILLAAAVISLVITAIERYVLGNEEAGFIDSIGIFLAVGLATLVGYFSERKSAREFELLNKVKDDIAIKVIRDGQVCHVRIGEVVVGDIVRLDRGDKVPADGILVESMGLYIDQSMLTGESAPVEKKNATGPVYLVDHIVTLEPSDERFVARGTMVSDGHGLFAVTAIGDATQMGMIAQALADDDEDKNETPLTAKLSVLARQISAVGVSGALGIFTIMTLIATSRPDVLQELSPGEWGVLAGLAFFVGWGLSRFALKPFFAQMEMPIQSRAVSLVCLLTMGIAAFSLLTGIWMMVSLSSPESGIALLKSVLLAFVVAVTIIVVAVPEGLPMMVTVSLALNMMKMVKENCLVRKLVASETIGSATVICTDKTGTLTQNQMKPVWVYLGNCEYTAEQFGTLITSSDWAELVDGIAINSEAYLHIDHADDPAARKVTGIGNPTECALLKFLDEQKIAYLTMREKFPRVWELNHNSDRKMSAVLVDQGDDKKCYIKGAPERVLAHCDSLLVNGKIEPIVNHLAELQAHIAKASDNALRVIAFSVKTSCSQDCESCSGQTLVALVGIADPIRPEAPLAVKTCFEAGIQVKMITGDALPTAVAIARTAKIYTGEPDQLVLTSEEFANISDEELPAVAQQIRVLARSTPHDKLRLVKALHHQGEVVAMTGDGTNDAPALKFADVGLAMGITGTEVAKEASDIVLVDDNFKSIVTGVWWGRTLFQNIQRFLQFQLSVNVVAMLCALIGPLVGIPLPLTVTQLLWINIIMDTFAAIALSTDPPRPRTMKEKPISRDAHIITPTMGITILLVSLYQVGMLFATIFCGWFVAPDRVYDFTISPISPDYLEHNLQALTVFFTVLIMFQFWHKINCRALRHDESPFALIGKNKLFIMIVLLITAVQIIMVQSPMVGKFFRTEPLNLTQWLWIALVTMTVIPVAWLARQVAWKLGVEKD